LSKVGEGKDADRKGSSVHQKEGSNQGHTKSGRPVRPGEDFFVGSEGAQQRKESGSSWRGVRIKVHKTFRLPAKCLNVRPKSQPHQDLSDLKRRFGTRHSDNTQLQWITLWRREVALEIGGGQKTFPCKKKGKKKGERVVHPNAAKKGGASSSGGLKSNGHNRRKKSGNVNQINTLAKKKTDSERTGELDRRTKGSYGEGQKVCVARLSTRGPPCSDKPSRPQD